jgi:hypothetical protein
LTLCRDFGFGGVFFFFGALALAKGFDLDLLNLRTLDFVRFLLLDAMAQTFLVPESTTVALYWFSGAHDWKLLGRLL